MARLRILLYESPNDPALNLALDEALLLSSACRGWIGVRFWRNRRAVVVGYNIRVEDHVNVEAAASIGAQILRRISGGGAVYHDLGNLNYSFYYPAALNPVQKLVEVSGVVAVSLQKLGFKPIIVNESDVVVNGYKVSGNASTSRWGATLVHGTLLIDTSPELVSRITPRPRKVPAHIDPVKYRVSSLSRLAGRSITVSEAIEALLASFEEYTGLSHELDLPTEGELEAALVLRSRHLDQDWVWGRKKLNHYRGLLDRARRLACS